MRYFNTSGPVVAEDHYCIPPLDRMDVDELLRLVAWKRYFVLHAPRQTGKTSALLALQALLNAQGEYRCVYVNVEGAQAMREDVERALHIILGQLAREAEQLGDDYLAGSWSDIWKEYGPGALGEALARWAVAADKPLALLIDEIDSLVGDSLLAVLRQLQANYHARPDGFPQSVILCGVRDVRDSLNIKPESLRLGDFDRDEIAALLRQHTEETGQRFSTEALQAIWTQTMGQPLLVNALAYETCFRGGSTAERSRTVTEADVLQAREQLILRRDTHLDQLTDKLREDQVWRVVAPLLTNSDRSSYTARDVEYVRDLGLVAPDRPLRMANPIYAEVATWRCDDRPVGLPGRSP